MMTFEFAMFGQTAKQWREVHPELKGNIRDYASINELICLANMENINAVLIDEGVPQESQFLEGLNARKARYLSEPYVFILNL